MRRDNLYFALAVVEGSSKCSFTLRGLSGLSRMIAQTAKMEVAEEKDRSSGISKNQDGIGLGPDPKVYHKAFSVGGNPVDMNRSM
jgi:hypothetical protein